MYNLILKGKRKIRLQHAVWGVMFSCALLFLERVTLVSSFWSHLQLFVGTSVEVVGELLPFAKVHVWLETNISLQKKVASMELHAREQDAKLLLLSHIEKENDDLRATLASVSGQKKEWVPAHFIFGDGELFVDVGRRDGVVPYSTLMFKGMYLGNIKDVSQFTSSTNTVWTPGARFGVRIEPSGAQCVLQVSISGKKVTCLSRIDDVHIGDSVVTLGDVNTDGGMLVGYVTADLTQTADAISTFTLRTGVSSIEKITTILIKKGRE